ncbi:hypothetical protein [Leisingera sp. ANG59]|uniref:hypothetical protein n=1 Tax=Leisingera sp. ANG59 TaxID=2675221 RepID=UPI0034A03B11
MEQEFRDAFAAKAELTFGEVSDWFWNNASAATPQSQRSEAQVPVEAATASADLGLLSLIDHIDPRLV